MDIMENIPEKYFEEDKCDEEVDQENKEVKELKY